MVPANGSPIAAPSTAAEPPAGGPAPLDYATPTAAGPRRPLKYVAAVGFAVVAIPLGLLFAWVALIAVGRASDTSYTVERRTFRAAAVGFAECSAVLLPPGLYYARVGTRGLAATAAADARPVIVVG